MNCWEFMKCGYEQGGGRTTDGGTCPAYPDFGQHCARVAGTLCEGKVQGTFAVKLASCLHCNFYKSEHYDRSYAAAKIKNFT